MPTRPPGLFATDVRVPRIEGLTVQQLLGRGGMGAVFLAVEDRTGDRVAVKVAADLAQDPAARARFLEEIDVVSRIRSRHVVRLRRSGEADGIPFAVFDFVPGIGLHRVATPLWWPVAVHLSWQLAAAVAATHDAGFLHRDIKPSNVMVGRKGWLTLIDFGLARRIARPGHTRELALTDPGTCVGTPRFVAPEVAFGEPATIASDLYSLGLVIGRLSGADDVRNHADLPEALIEIVAALGAREPVERPASAATVVAALDTIHHAPGRYRIVASDAPPTWRQSACERVTLSG